MEGFGIQTGTEEGAEARNHRQNEAGEVSWPDDELILRAIDKVC